jgi:hypothetical protein
MRAISIYTKLYAFESSRATCRRKTVRCIELSERAVIREKEDCLVPIGHQTVSDNHWIINESGGEGFTVGVITLPSKRALAGKVPTKGLISGPNGGHAELPKNVGLEL